MVTKDGRPVLSGDGHDQPPVGQDKAKPIGSTAVTNGCKAIVVQEVEDRDSLFTFLVFVRLPSKDPSRETAQSRKLDGDAVAVVIEGSGWVLRLPLRVRQNRPALR